jgi:hypothetical protein
LGALQAKVPTPVCRDVLQFDVHTEVGVKPSSVSDDAARNLDVVQDRPELYVQLDDIAESVGPGETSDYGTPFAIHLHHITFMLTLHRVFTNFP